MKNNQSGFTLVELAIVMVIIGILLGGVLKGQELITNAKASATIAQIEGIEAATNTFRDAYDAIPGDMPNSGTRLPNCGGVLFVCNIPTTFAATAPFTGNRQLEYGPGFIGAGPLRAESYSYFTQLAAADLIGEVDSTVTYNIDNLRSWSARMYPEAPLGGGFNIGWTDGTSVVGFPDITGGETPRRGLWLVLHDNPSQLTRPPEILQPSHALRIDNKMDDGDPYTGFVRGAGSEGGGDGDCTDGTDYNGTSTQPVCFLYIRLGG